MSDKKAVEISNLVDFSIRWRPDFRYRTDKFEKITLNNFSSNEPTVTDTEAYRITLASLRGELAQGSGRPDVGSYSLKAGEEYNPQFDFSFLNRKDLTIVELDNYISIMKRNLEESDEALSQEIRVQIANAESKRQTLEKSQQDKNDKVE